MLRKEVPHVVILGGGFGGLAAARGLRRSKVRVTLVDRTNHHVFQPLLYQVATAALSAPDIAAPIRRLVRSQSNTTVLMAEVLSIDPAERRVMIDGGSLAYDYLIVATGMTHAYFGHDEWARHSLALKTLGEALAIRGAILRAFEEAEREPDPERRREDITFAVIGGGPTGVELAGAVAEIARRTLARDFRNFDPKRSRVVLIEAGPRILASFDPQLSETARLALLDLGVEIRSDTKVTALEEGLVRTESGEIRAHTILWAAGVKASPLTVCLGAELDRAGRVKVEDDLRVPGRPEIFVLGDLIAKQQDGKWLPGVAQVGMQSGAHAAINIERAIRGEPGLPFRYNDKGSMATIGRAKAIAEIGAARFSGLFAWLLWLFVHVMFLVDFRSRIAVLLEWAWAYFTWARSSRVIVEAPARAPAPSRGSSPEITSAPAPTHATE